MNNLLLKKKTGLNNWQDENEILNSIADSERLRKERLGINVEEGNESSAKKLINKKKKRFFFF